MTFLHSSSSSFLLLVVAFLCSIVILTELVDGCGFPTGGGGGGGCCCCGGCGGGCGGFGGFGRRRRSAVQPHYRGPETPCPQSAWEKPMIRGIQRASDAVSSVHTVHGALLDEYPQQRFLVSCVDLLREERKKLHQQLNTKDLTLLHRTDAKKKEEKRRMAAETAQHFSFISSGDAYCSVRAENVFCQAIAMSA